MASCEAPPKESLCHYLLKEIWWRMEHRIWTKYAAKWPQRCETATYFINSKSIVNIMDIICQHIEAWRKWQILCWQHFQFDFLNENVTFLLKFQFCVLGRVQLTISQHWLRWSIGAKQATSHYLTQWFPTWLMLICITRPQWLKYLSEIITWHTSI